MKIITTTAIVTNDEEKNRIMAAVKVIKEIQSSIDETRLEHMWEVLDDAKSYLVAILEGRSF